MPSTLTIAAARKMKYALLLGASFLLLGCQTVSQQRPASEADDAQRKAVVVTEDQERVADCRHLTDVVVASPFPFMNKAFPELTSLGEQETTKMLRREARQVGGDTVLRLGEQGGKMQGRAYDCRQAGA